MPKRSEQRRAQQRPGGSGVLPRRRLSERQQRFVKERVCNVQDNATLDAIRAGYAAASASVQAARLLAMPNIVAAIEEAHARVRVDAAPEITIVDLLRELAILAKSDITNYILDEKGRFILAPDAPRSAWRAVQSINYELNSITKEIKKAKISLWSKPEAIALAGKHLGMFIERIAAIVARVPPDFVTAPPRDLQAATRFLEEQLGLVEVQVQMRTDGQGAGAGAGAEQQDAGAEQAPIDVKKEEP